MGRVRKVLLNLARPGSLLAAPQLSATPRGSLPDCPVLPTAGKTTRPCRRG